MTFKQLILERSGITLNEEVYAEIKTNGMIGKLQRPDGTQLSTRDLLPSETKTIELLKANQENWGKIFSVIPNAKLDLSSTKQIKSMPKTV